MKKKTYKKKRLKIIISIATISLAVGAFSVFSLGLIESNPITFSNNVNNSPDSKRNKITADEKNGNIEGLFDSKVSNHTLIEQEVASDDNKIYLEISRIDGTYIGYINNQYAYEEKLRILDNDIYNILLYGDLNASFIKSENLKDKIIYRSSDEYLELVSLDSLNFKIRDYYFNTANQKITYLVTNSSGSEIYQADLNEKTLDAKQVFKSSEEFYNFLDHSDSYIILSKGEKCSKLNLSNKKLSSVSCSEEPIVSVDRNGVKKLDSDLNEYTYLIKFDNKTIVSQIKYINEKIYYIKSNSDNLTTKSLIEFDIEESTESVILNDIDVDRIIDYTVFNNVAFLNTLVDNQPRILFKDTTPTSYTGICTSFDCNAISSINLGSGIVSIRFL
ncbi:MAG: hypothetical protein Q9M76_01790 [Candidatus Dojkabacteria bacterium]|nr:hypothetical protein [Candidatus Dojkabacteria bacterium]